MVNLIGDFFCFFSDFALVQSLVRSEENCVVFCNPDGLIEKDFFTILRDREFLNNLNRVFSSASLNTCSDLTAPLKTMDRVYQ